MPPDLSGTTYQLFDAGSVLRYGDKILMLSTWEYPQENGRMVSSVNHDDVAGGLGSIELEKE